MNIISVNRKIITSVIASVLMLVGASCSKLAPGINFTAKNNLDIPVVDAVLELKNADFIAKVNSEIGSEVQAFENNIEIPCQTVDINYDNVIEAVIVLANFKPGETKTITLRKAGNKRTEFPKRTQAELSVKENGEWKEVTKNNGMVQYEYKGGVFKNINELRVPDFHTDHSFFIRYEGPGWESDKVGYRFYLDWRNATDIFGKKTTNMVLQNVGQDGFDSYHEESNWGMDILKVGNSLGIGSFGFWDGTNANRVALTDSIISKISENGIIQSKIETEYFGWHDCNLSVDLISELSINAGSRLSYQKIILSEGIENICTGIVKLDSTEVLIPANENSAWTYYATYGKQSLNNDSLGMVLFYKKADLIQLTEDLYSHVVVLRPQNNTVEYYFGAAWEKEPEGIKTKSDFVEYLNSMVKILNSPVEINY